MCTISVAYDEAFLFYYRDNLDAIREAGADIVYFSPLLDEALPACDGLYIGGGYPELHEEALLKNAGMCESIRTAVTAGLPTVAECGGFMYLVMTDALPGEVYPTDSAKRFGYLTIHAENDSMLFLQGEDIPAHEYHHWDCTDCGSDLLAKKADGRTWRFGYAGDTIYAGFPHLHFGGKLPLAERFEALFKEKPVRHITTVSADSILEVAAGRDDFSMCDEDFAAFASYHFATCEKRELLGAANHLLYICQKQK